MRRRIGTLPLLAVFLAACSGAKSNSENSVTCGLASVAGSALVMQTFQNGSTVLQTAPDLPSVIAARVVGHGTAKALVASGADGLALGYEGEGFPTSPGFGLLLVDDSSEVVRGVLIFEASGPETYPKLGTISSATSTIPLYGMRVSWSSASDPRCPLIGALPDSAKS